MSNITHIEVLKQARALITDPAKHTQSYFARDPGNREVSASHPSAVCWCAWGAIKKVSPDNLSREMAAVYALADTIIEESPELQRAVRLGGPCHSGILYRFNDSHTHAEVLDLFDRTIARLEAA